VGWLARVCVLGAGLGVVPACGDDDDMGGSGAGGAAAASGGASGSAGTRPGSSGSGQTSTGGSGTSAGAGTGSSGNSGSGASGSGASGSGASGSGNAGAAGGGEVDCDLECPDNQHCELVPVTCIRAPCPAQPQCVAASGGSAGGGAMGATCGTRGAGPCADGQYCMFPASANCGRADAPGRCQPKPGVCTFELNPVCGCDGETYSNPCAAASAGVSVEGEGECEQANADTVDCDPRKVACDELPQSCPQGQVRALRDACYGDCVDVEACKCSAPGACPMPDSYTCHMSAGHCGPYV
jgi:hypothetical protein